MRTTRVAVTISRPAADLIDRLLETGLYGRTRADVAREFVYRGLRENCEMPKLVLAAERARGRR